MYHNMDFYFSNTGNIFKCVLIQFRERFCFQRWAHIYCLFSHYLPLDSIDKLFFFTSPRLHVMTWNYIIFFSLNLGSLPSVPSRLTPQKTRYDFFSPNTILNLFLIYFSLWMLLLLHISLLQQTKGTAEGENE